MTLPFACMTLRGLALSLACVACTPVNAYVTTPATPVETPGPVQRDPSPPAAPSPAAAALLPPFVVGEVWTGDYQCPQGTTTARLRIESGEGVRLTGTFEFEHEASGSRGAFGVVGGYDPDTQHLAFAPARWIAQPIGYTTIGLDGYVNDRGLYSGMVTNRECGRFEFRRQR